MEGRDRQAELDAAVKFKYDEHARPLAPLPLGTHVRVRDPPSKLWDKVGVVVSIGRYRSYRIKFESGSVLWRNRRLLRPMVVIPDAGEPSPEADVHNTDGEGGDERSSVDHPMAAGSADGVSVPSPLPTDPGNTEDADVPNTQPRNSLGKVVMYASCGFPPPTGRCPSPPSSPAEPTAGSLVYASLVHGGV
ncbi:hypothetical protein DAPPUDRAFT_106664 [Daphnia pulex]|uniref:Uncharacterized protein n=1 Tax=Daphnia pulex TaxID=6669 RepID=E9GUN8_DAPPU|nr:hypothetical protein DAPPUDRAFT_106664 [Daphnia pulex]|eukprot:EFX76906.1 hypothetical protein DAPPUDRAFT_106664 [Daphnia pulex]